MVNDTIYDYNELKLKLLEFSESKIIDEKAENIKFYDIKKKLEDYKDKPNQDKKYITIFLCSNDKVIKQYDDRVDKINLNFLNQYINEKSNLTIIVYFFDMNINRDKYIGFMNKCENIRLKINIKNYIYLFFKYVLPLSGFLGIFFTMFTIFALSEYGIPTSKVVDFPIIAILLMFSLSFIVLLFSTLIIAIPFIVIPLLFNVFTDYNNIFILTSFQFILMIIIILYFRRYMPYLLNKILPGFVKSSIYVLALCTVSFSIIFLFSMSQSVLSSFFPHSIFYNKSGYELVMEQYITRFSGYPKLIIKDNKRYYVPVADSEYYYVYDLNESKKRYIGSLKKHNIKSKLSLVCKDIDTKKEFQKNYIVNNPYIKPRFLTKKMNINNKDIGLKPLVGFNNIISLEEIDKLCESNL